MNHPFAKKSLGEIVAEELRQDIWTKKMTFGERLIESDLSERFDVSRNTIRDALKILEFEELVVSKPRKGTYVTEFSRKDWQEIIDLRSILESYAFVKALSLLEEKHFNDLRAILMKMEEKVEEKSWNDLFDLDMEFHSYIVNMSGHSRVIKIYQSVQVQIRTFFLYLDQYYSSHESFYREQKELYDALLTKDPAIVSEKVKTHISYVEGQFLG